MIIFEPTKKALFPIIGTKLKDKRTGNIYEILAVDTYDGTVHTENGWYYLEFVAIISYLMEHRSYSTLPLYSNSIEPHHLKICMFSLFTTNSVHTRYGLGELTGHGNL
jgi:hypothetical protein